MHWKAKIWIGIVLLILLVSFTAYAQDLNSELCRAAKEGNITTVETLLTKGADVNAKNKYGRTALMYAANEGHTETVDALLAKGADVNAKDKDGIMALMYAAMMGHTEIVKAFLAKGADVKAKDKESWTALMWAAKNGHTETVDALLAKGADVKAKDKYGGIALMIAAGLGHTEIVKALLAKGADVKAKDKKGRTALMVAEMLGYTEIVKTLLAKGADVKAKDKEGVTALVEPELLHAVETKTKTVLDESKTREQFSKASTSLEQLETFLESYSLSQTSKSFQQEVEDKFISLLLASDVSKRFSVKKFLNTASKTRPRGDNGSVTIQAVDANVVEFTLEYPKDRQPIYPGGAVLPMGHGSIWRFKGKLTDIGGMNIDAKTDDPLRFVLIDGRGLVYLYGTGILRLDSNKATFPADKNAGGF